MGEGLMSSSWLRSYGQETEKSVFLRILSQTLQNEFTPMNLLAEQMGMGLKIEIDTQVGW